MSSYWWVGVMLLAGWLVACLFERRWQGAHLTRLLIAASASVVFAYYVVLGTEPRTANRFFLVLGLSLCIREGLRLAREKREEIRR